MTIDDIKNFLDDSLIKQLKLNTEVPSNLKINKPILKQILNKYNWLQNANELIYLLLHKNELEKLHIFCPICGNKNKFICKTIGYLQHCSTRCSTLDPYVQKKSSYSSMKNWGYKHPSQSPIVKKKHEDTNLERRGVKSPLQIKEIHDKGIKAAATPEVRQLVRKRKEEKYNDPNYHNFEQAQETYYKKTGYKTTFYNPEVREKSRQKFQEKYNKNSYVETHEFQEKSSKTIQQKFNVSNYTKSQDYKNKKSIIVKKGFETRKKNGTLGSNRSKAEIRCYEKAKLKFPDIRNSYFEDSRYPFNCDMYIPSQDLFIECHFSQYHHYHPFDKNCIGDLVELSKLNHIIRSPYLMNDYKEEYIKIKNTWTISDPLKLKTFIDNRLNYKIFYTEKEFIEWFNSLP